MNKQQIKNKLLNFHNKSYKALLMIPAIILVFCFVYMFYFYQQNQDFFYKDISLTGGTTITIYEKIDYDSLKKEISGKLENLYTREIYDIITQEKKAIVIETKTDVETAKKIIESYLGHELNEENSSIEFTGSVLSESFLKQLLFAILIAFILMSLVVFLIFRTFVPSIAVIISAFADIFMTLTLVNILGIKISSAGIVAFLMLIGYSVDTDILLTNRVLRSREDTVNRRIFSAFKTGITMTLTAIASIGLALIIVGGFSAILKQIFLVILIGLFFDLLNTWVTNVSLIKWYALSSQEAQK